MDPQLYGFDELAYFWEKLGVIYGSIDSPWAPTPKEVVNYIMDAVLVGYGDIVYDLGCGDGRVVIEAARRGAKGVCIEIDAKLIELAKDNAAKVKVDDRIEFINDDIASVDLSQATIVYLYLTSKLITKIKSKMLKELKTGTIIIALDYDVEGLDPVDILMIYLDRKIYKVYLYIVQH